MEEEEEERVDTRAKPTPPHLLHGHSPLVLSREVDAIMRAASPLWARNSPDSLAQQRRAAPQAPRGVRRRRRVLAPVVGPCPRWRDVRRQCTQDRPRTRGQSARRLARSLVIVADDDADADAADAQNVAVMAAAGG